MNADKIKLIDNALEYLSGHKESCRLCPRECRVNRYNGEQGKCGASDELIIYTAFLHKGEEPPLSGSKGSGAVFFSGCGLRCFYCQNYHFSHELRGDIFTCEDLAELMLSLEDKGAHNINLVTPTHYLIPVLNALRIALKKGMGLPVVYNSSGYEKEDIVRCLDGIIDIYLPDFKYNTSEIAALGSQAGNYPEYGRKALLEMFRQQKTTVWDGMTLRKGMIVRHLVLPGEIEQSKQVISWLQENLPGVLTSIMFQYRPYHLAESHERFNRPVSFKEYEEMSSFLESLELNGWVQEFNPPDNMAGVYFKPFPN